MKHVLLAVTGMSPQVVTETLYAMHVHGDPMPNEIYLITTGTGKDQAWLTLGVGNGEQQGKLHQFYTDYKYPPIEFSKENIWVVSDKEGRQLSDVHTDAEHRAMADFITSKVAELTKDRRISLHASLAGGRKTMTFFLGYAMSLYAREQDSLSHVLVTKGYEGLPDFFYPTPYDAPVKTNSGIILNARDANVTLARIPFVRMRQEVPKKLLTGNSSYSEVVDSLNRARQEAKLHLITKKRLLMCDGEEITLMPKQFAMYRWLAWRAKHKLEPIPMPTELGDDQYLEEILDHNAEVVDSFRADEERLGMLKNGYTKQTFEQYKSKIKKKIQDVLGDSWGKKFIIDEVSVTKAGRKLYGISVKPHNIEID